MLKYAIAILLVSSSAYAQSTPSRDCTPIGQTAKGELVYAMDCKSMTTGNATDANAQKTDANVEKMPATNIPNTVIPKSGATESPPATTPKGDMK
jgi:hypothetical protein